MPKYLSGRVKRTDQAYLSTDRYQYLGLEQAEPNLADPPAGGTSPNIPVGQRSQIISVQGFPGERFWVPVEGGLIPGAISVFEEGTLVGGSSSTTQLDFRGNIITAIGNRTGLSNPGVAVTLSVDPPGTDGQLLFNKNGDFGGATLFNYDDSTVGVASVGIGTTAPTQNLHILGNLRLENSFFDSTNFSGNQGQLLVRSASGGLEYANAATVPTGAGGTFGNVQFHDDTGLVDGAPNFVYIETDERVGIGSTQPKVLLDVVGIASFSNLTIAGVLTASQEQGGLDFETDVRFKGANYNAEWDISESALEFKDEAKATFGNGRDLEILHTNSLSSQTDSNGDSIVDGRTSLIEERGSGGLIFKSNGGDGPGAYQFFDQNWHPLLKMHGGNNNARVALYNSGNIKFVTAETGAIVTGIFTATEEIQADKITTIDNNFVNIDVSGIATMGNIDTDFIDAENIDVGFATVTDKLDVTGFTTTKNIFAAGIGTFLQLQVDNIKIDGSKVESTTGNLILESVTNTITVNDVIFVDNSDDSTSKDTGSIISQGGIGVEKSVFVGTNLSVVGLTTLASDGGITTTGGDLYIGGDLYVDDDIVLDNINAGSVFVSGISTFIGLSTFNGGLSVESGLSTFRGNVFVAAGATVGLGDSVFIPNNKKIIFGDNNDFEISHTTSLAGQNAADGEPVTSGADRASLIEDVGQGPLVFKSNHGGGPGAFQFFDADWRPLIRMKSGGGDLKKQVILYFNSEERIQTNTSGVKVSGITSMTGNLRVGQYVESNLSPSAETFNLGESGKSWQNLYIKEIIGTDKIGVDQSTVNLLDVTGIATIATLGVSGLTTTKDLIVTGLSTFKGNSIFESNVGIGTQDPDTDLHVYTEGSVLVSLFESETDHSRLRIKAPSDKYSQLEFSDDDADTGEIRYDHTDDSMQFFVNSNDEKVRITSDGSVGIGTSIPDQKLHVMKGGAGTVASDGNAVITVENSDHSIIQMLSPANKSNRIMFGNPDDGSNIGQISYDHNTDELIFHVNGNDRVNIDSSGNLLRGGTDQDIGASTAPWDKIYANQFLGQVGESQGTLEVGSLLVTGIATFRDKVLVSTGATVGFGDSIFIPDDKKIIFGDDDDFQISHTNSLANQTDANGDAVTTGSQTASFIEEAGPGPMIFKSDGGGGPGAFQFYDANWRPILKLHSGNQSRVKLYYNSNLTLETKDFGLQLTGKVGINEDNPENQLHVYHATDNIVGTFASGDAGAGISLKDNSHRTKIKTDSGTFEVDVDNDEQLSSRSISFKLGGSEKLNINNDGDLLRGGASQDIGANGSPWNNVYANQFIGDIRKTQQELTITNLDVTGIATFRKEVQFKGNSYNIKWDHDNDKLEFEDDAKITFGNAGGTPDLQIYHSSTNAHSYIQDSGTGDLVLLSNEVAIRNAAETEDLARFKQTQGVELYDGASQIRLNTNNTGVNITGELVTGTAKVSNLTDGRVVLAGSQGKLEDSGNLTFDGTKLTINGNLLVTGEATYEGVTNIESVGIVTAGKGFRALLGGLIISSGISTFSDVIRPQHGNNENSGIQWADNIGGGTGDKAYIRYYVQGDTGENTRLEIRCRNDADDDIYLNSQIVNISNDLKVTDNLNVNGNTTLGNGDSDTVTFTARVNSSILPSLNAADSDPLSSGYDLGGSNNQWRKVFAREFSGAVIGNADTATKLATERNIAITGDLEWNVDFDGSSDVSGQGTLANSGVTADTYGSSTQIPRITVDAKGRITAATTNGFDLTGATANSANKIKINNTDNNQDYYLTFVESSGNEKDVYIDGELKYNPRGNVLTTRNIFPDQDDTRDLGKSDDELRWNNVYAKHFRGGTFYGTIDSTVSAFSLNASTEDIFSVESNILSANTTPSEDKIIFFDKSTDKLTHLTVGSYLSIDGTTLNGTGDNNTQYSLPLSHSGTANNANTVKFDLTGTDGTVDTVTITKGSGVTFSSVGTGGFTISADSQSGTTYNLGTNIDTTIGANRIRLTGSDSTTNDINIVGSGGITISSSNSIAGGTINISGGSVTGTTYNLQVPENTTNIELQGTTTDANLNRVAIVGGEDISVVRTAHNILTINGTSGSAIPSGTRMLFQQTSAPTGWTKVTSGVNNRALRLVTGTVGTGGSRSFTSAFNSSRTTTGGSVAGHILSILQMPAHHHQIFNNSTNAGAHPRTSNIDANSYVARGTGAVRFNEGYNMRQAGNNATDGKTSTRGGGVGGTGGAAQAHGHSFTNPSISLNVRYTDVIIAVKD